MWWVRKAEGGVGVKQLARMPERRISDIRLEGESIEDT